MERTVLAGGSWGADAEIQTDDLMLPDGDAGYDEAQKGVERALRPPAGADRALRRRRGRASRR